MKIRQNSCMSYHTHSMFKLTDAVGKNNEVKSVFLYVPNP